MQQALNEQTYEQFRIYAEQQFPGDPERQGDLVKQLQDQHYLQYMQQLQASAMNHSPAIVAPKPKVLDETVDEENQTNHTSDCNASHIEGDDDRFNDNIAPASMWTTNNISEFKETVLKSEGDGVVRVGHGETVTVRVPTTKSGSQLFWEFATDHYDIGMYES